MPVSKPRGHVIHLLDIKRCLKFQATFKLVQSFLASDLGCPFQAKEERCSIKKTQDRSADVSSHMGTNNRLIMGVARNCLREHELMRAREGEGATARLF